MRKRSVAIYLGLTALAVLALRTHSKSSPEAEPQVPETEIASNSDAAREPASVEKRLAPPPTLGERAVAATQAAQPTSVRANLTAEEKERLADFAQLKAKVFTTDEEKLRRRSLLMDSSYLQRMATILTAQTVATPNEQNAALDLLLEAAAADPRGPSNAILKSIVADPTIENTALPLSVREEIAGLKAELLYRWTAEQPERVSEVASAIPGPVTSQIWKNVQDQHEQNRLESETVR